MPTGLRQRGAWPVICEFLRVYPDVNVRLVLGDRMVNLLEDQVDLAVRIGALPDSGLIATSLGRIRRVVCASPAYLDFAMSRLRARVSAVEATLGAAARPKPGKRANVSSRRASASTSRA